MEEMKNKFLWSIYDRLVISQHEAHISNYRLSIICGISQGNLSHFTHRERVPGIASLCKIALALGVDINDYLEKEIVNQQ